MQFEMFKFWSRAALVTLIVVLGSLSAQASGWGQVKTGPAIYADREVGRMEQVLVGVVEDIRPVTIASQGSDVARYGGAAAGTAVGAILGQSIGEGNGQRIASILTGIAGGFAGQKLGEVLSNESIGGVEMIVTLSNGQTVAITQQADAETMSLRPGDKVRLVGGNPVRVVRLRSM